MTEPKTRREVLKTIGLGVAATAVPVGAAMAAQGERYPAWEFDAYRERKPTATPILLRSWEATTKLTAAEYRVLQSISRPLAGTINFDTFRMAHPGLSEPRSMAYRVKLASLLYQHDGDNEAPCSVTYRFTSSDIDWRLVQLDQPEGGYKLLPFDLLPWGRGLELSKLTDTCIVSRLQRMV